MAAEVENEENAVPSAAAAATAAAGAEADRKRKHAEAQARYQARQKACEARAAHLRDWDHLTEAEQAAAGCLGFTNSELWQARLEQSAHSRDVESGAIDLQADKWLLPWCSLSSDDRSAARALGYSSESWEWQMLGEQRLRWSEVVFVEPTDRRVRLPAVEFAHVIWLQLCEQRQHELDLDERRLRCVVLHGPGTEEGCYCYLIEEPTPNELAAWEAERSQKLTDLGFASLEDALLRCQVLEREVVRTSFYTCEVCNAQYAVSQPAYKCSADCNATSCKKAQAAAAERVHSNREERRALHFAVGPLGSATRPPVKRRAIGLPSDPNPHRREHPLPPHTSCWTVCMAHGEVWNGCARRDIGTTSSSESWSPGCIGSQIWQQE